jgi:hypothetical protein
MGAAIGAGIDITHKQFPRNNLVDSRPEIAQTAVLYLTGKCLLDIADAFALHALASRYQKTHDCPNKTARVHRKRLYAVMQAVTLGSCLLLNKISAQDQ